MTTENKTFTKIYSNIERPKETKCYLTNIGEMKFDLTTNSFYDKANNVVDFAVKYWMKPIVSFEEVSNVMIKYIAENHHPHTMVNIDSTKAELFEGVKSNINNDFLKD